jgi:hypothetical protein
MRPLRAPPAQGAGCHRCDAGGRQALHSLQGRGGTGAIMHRQPATPPGQLSDPRRVRPGSTATRHGASQGPHRSPACTRAAHLLQQGATALSSLRLRLLQRRRRPPPAVPAVDIHGGALGGKARGQSGADGSVGCGNVNLPAAGADHLIWGSQAKGPRSEQQQQQALGSHRSCLGRPGDARMHPQKLASLPRYAFPLRRQRQLRQRCNLHLCRSQRPRGPPLWIAPPQLRQPRQAERGAGWQQLMCHNMRQERHRTRATQLKGAGPPSGPHHSHAGPGLMRLQRHERHSGPRPQQVPFPHCRAGPRLLHLHLHSLHGGSCPVLRRRKAHGQVAAPVQGQRRR